MLTLPDFPGLKDRLSKEPGFARAVTDMAARLNLEVDPILAVMSYESGGTFDPAVTNSIGAVGLIQFIPSTAQGLGTSTSELRNMTAIEQLAYVEKFFRQNGRRIRRDTPGDYYMAVFMPAYVGADPTTVLGQKDSTEILAGSNRTKGKIWEQNPGLRHGDTITVADVWNVVNGRLMQAKGRPAIQAPDPLAPGPASASRSPSLPPAWRSSGGRFDLPVLRVGAKGTAVTLCQVLMGCDVVTGVYTEAMAVDYVRPFQRRHGIDVDAVIGRQTWEALAEGLKERPTEIPPGPLNG